MMVMVMKLSVCFLIIYTVCLVVVTNGYRLGSSYHGASQRIVHGSLSNMRDIIFVHRSSSSSGSSEDTIVELDKSSNKIPTPGSPVIKFIDKVTNIASMSVAIDGTITQKAYSEACDLFNAVRYIE